MRQRLIARPGFADFWTPTQQPLGPVQIDRSHWFGAALNPSNSICCLGRGNATVDLVSGRPATLTGTVSPAANILGKVATSDGSSANSLAWAGMPAGPSNVTFIAVFTMNSAGTFPTLISTSGGSSGVGLTGNANPLQFIRGGVAFDSLGWPSISFGVPYFCAASWNGTNVNHVLARLDTNSILASGTATSGAANAGDGKYSTLGGQGRGLDGSVALAAVQPQRYPLAQLLELASNPYAFLKPLQRGPLVGVPAVSGTAGQTLQHLTQAALGAGTISGTAAQTLQHLTQAAAGAANLSGTAAQTLQHLSQAASSVSTVSGTAAQTLQHLTQAALGADTASGSAVQALPHLAQAATSVVTVTGSAAQTLQRLTQSAIAVTTVSGSAAQTLKRLTMQAIASSADTTKMFLVMR